MLKRLSVFGFLIAFLVVKPVSGKEPSCEVSLHLRDGQKIQFTEETRNCQRFTEQIIIYKKDKFNSYDLPVEDLDKAQSIELTGPARPRYKGSMVITYKEGRIVEVEDAKLTTKDGDDLILEYKVYDKNLKKWVKDMIEVERVNKIVFTPSQ